MTPEDGMKPEDGMTPWPACKNNGGLSATTPKVARSK